MRYAARKGVFPNAGKFLLKDDKVNVDALTRLPDKDPRPYRGTSMTGDVASVGVSPTNNIPIVPMRTPDDLGLGPRRLAGGT